MSACAAEMRPITRRWAALSVAARGFPRLVTMGGAEARSNRVVTSLTLIHLRRLVIIICPYRRLRLRSERELIGVIERQWEE